MTAEEILSIHTNTFNRALKEQDYIALEGLTPGEKQCHLNRTGNVIETLRLDKTPEAYARMMERKWLSMPSAGKRSTI